MKSALVLAAATFLFALGVGGVRAAEADAVNIARNIRRVHMPHGTVINPVFASTDPTRPDYGRIMD